MPRLEFSVAVKKAAFDRAGGICECGCGQPLSTRDAKSRPEYDHIIEDMLDGGNGLDNCQCIRLDCHKAKTRDRSAILAKVRRSDRKRQGISPTKRLIPGSKGSGIRKGVDGSVRRE